MKTTLLLLLALFTATASVGQEHAGFTSSNVYLELLGAAGLVSGNYEKLLPLNEVAGFSARVGVGIYPTNLGILSGQTRLAAVFPVMFNFIYGRTFALETGVGASLASRKNDFDTDSIIKYYNGTLGVRYQKPGRGLILRLGFTPIMLISDFCRDNQCTERDRTSKIQPGVGFSIGTRIKSE